MNLTRSSVPAIHYKIINGAKGWEEIIFILNIYARPTELNSNTS